MQRFNKPAVFADLDPLLEPAMHRTPIVTGIALAAVAGLTAPARAEMRVWTMCTPGSFHSCHSVSVRTLPVFTGNVRTGTNLTISVTNLQGPAFPADNTLHAALYRVAFFGRNMAGGPIGSFFTNNPTPTLPQVVGDARNDHQFQVMTDSYNAAGARYDFAGVFGILVGGCWVKDGTVFFTAFMTCGAQSAVIFSVDIASFVNAADFENAQIGAFDLLGAGGGQCMSDPGTFAQDPNNFPQPTPPQCDVLSNVLVTPEPVTITLLGTGLFGVAAARWRRRRPEPGPLA